MAVGDVGPGPFQGVRGVNNGPLTPEMTRILRQLFPMDTGSIYSGYSDYPLPRPDLPAGQVMTRFGPVPATGTMQGPGVPLGLNQLPELNPGPQMQALNPAPSIWEAGPVPGQLPNYQATGTVPGQAIPMGPAQGQTGGGLPQAQPAPSSPHPLQGKIKWTRNGPVFVDYYPIRGNAPNSSSVAVGTPGSTQVKTPPSSTLYADPSDVSSLRGGSDRVYGPRGNLSQGTFLGTPGSDDLTQIPRASSNGAGLANQQVTLPKPASQMIGGNAGVGAHGPFNPIGNPSGPYGPFNPNPPTPNWYDGLAKTYRGVRNSPQLGSSFLPESLTADKALSGGKIGTMRRIGEGVVPALAWQMTDNLVGNADPNKSLGPIDQGLLQSMTAGGSVGAVGGVPGSIAGATGAGAADAALNTLGGDTENDSTVVGLLKNAGRGVTGVAGGLMSIGDLMNKGDTGGVSGLIKQLTGTGEPEPVADQPTPQNLMDRVFDLAQTDSGTRQDLQDLYDIMIANGADPVAASEAIRESAIQDYTSRQQAERDSAQVLAQQAQAQKYMKPYADSIRAQGAAEQQLLTALLGTLPAEYQAYGQYAAGSAATRANTTADAYMAQAALVPPQVQQQRAYEQQQALNNQIQQRLQAQGISQAVEAYNASGGLSPATPLAGLGATGL